MFKPDSTLLIQIQLALIGIVVVVGLFYLWRIIVHLEERISKVACKCTINGGKPTNHTIPESQSSLSSLSPLQFMMPPQFDGENSQEDMMNAQELMQQVFGGGLAVNGVSMPGMPGMDSSDQQTVMMFSMESPMMTHPHFAQQPSGVVVEEMEESLLEKKSHIEDVDADDDDDDDDDIPELIDIPGEPMTYVATSVEVDDDAISVSTDSNPLSRSKLSQMKLEKLRELCKARDLSVEGLKPQLIERLLGLSRD